MKFLFNKSQTHERQAFDAFYAYYAPKLWGVILAANLPTHQSRTILMNTILTAWQHPSRHKLVDKQVLSWLTGLACAEGLPAGAVKSVFTAPAPPHQPTGGASSE